MTIVLTQRDRDYLQGTRFQRHRPAKFRRLLRIDRNVPDWAERIELRTIDLFASLKPINGLDDALPKPSVGMSQAFVRIYEFACAYDLTDREIQNSRALKTDLSTVRPIANQTAAEQLLERIASTGDATLGLRGIAGMASAPTPATGPYTVATDPDVILGELHALLFAVTNQSLENFKADTLLLPLATYQLLSTMRLSDGTDETVLTSLAKQAPGVKVEGWSRLTTAGAGGVTRAIAFDSQAPEGPRMVIPEELVDHEPVRKSLGWEIAQTLRTAGVVSDADEAVAYLDGV